MDWDGGDPEKMPLAMLYLQVCRLVGERLRLHVEKIGLHPSQGRVLAYLHRHDDVPQWRIARALHASPAAVTSVLQRLERDGWITRARDPNDQRMVRISLAEKARAAKQEMKETFKETEDEISAVYSEEERATLRRLLMKLYTRLAPHDALHTRDMFSLAEVNKGDTNRSD